MKSPSTEHIQACPSPGQNVATQACGALKATAVLIQALICHPGPGSTDVELSTSSRDILVRAATLTNAVLKLVSAKLGDKVGSEDRAKLKQLALEVTVTQWVNMHQQSCDAKEPEALISVLSTVLENGDQSDGEIKDYANSELSALLTAASVIYYAVNQFNYFNPKPERLVWDGIACIRDFIESVNVPITEPYQSQEFNSMMLEKLGAIYATTYSACARQDLRKLREMEEDERAFYIEAHPNGLSTTHIQDAFKQFADRLIKIAFEAMLEHRSPSVLSRLTPGV